MRGAFWAVIESGHLPRVTISVRRMHDGESLSGIGWASLGEYETKREADAHARWERERIKTLSLIDGEDDAPDYFGTLKR